ncbi:MAG: hypothetical protein J7647_19720 [Cyanobacteria bacterium SBLK]|nr:hypothetical protein [Cyanobacteria bacterium SBLK]
MLPQYQIDAAKALAGQIQQDYLGGAAPGGLPTIQPTETYVCYTLYGCPQTSPPLCLGVAAAAPGVGAATGSPTAQTRCFICPPPVPAVQGAPGTIFTEWCTLPPGAAAPVAGQAPGTAVYTASTVPQCPPTFYACPPTNPVICPAPQGAPGTGAVYTTYTAMMPACPPTSPPFCPTINPTAAQGAPGTIFTEWCTLPPGAAAPAPQGQAAVTLPPTFAAFCPTINPLCVTLGGICGPGPQIPPVAGAQGGAPGTIFTEWCTLPPGAAAPAAGGIAPTIQTAQIPVCPVPIPTASLRPQCPPTFYACPQVPAARGATAAPTSPQYTCHTTVPPFFPPAAAPAAQGAPGTIFTEWCTLPPGAAAPATGNIAFPTNYTMATPDCPPTVTAPTIVTIVPTTVTAQVPVCPPTIPVPTVVTAQIPVCPTPAAQGAPGTIFTEWCTLPPGAAGAAAGGIAPTIQTAQIPACPTPVSVPPACPTVPPVCVFTISVPPACPPTVFNCPPTSPIICRQGAAPGAIAVVTIHTCPPTYPPRCGK